MATQTPIDPIDPTTVVGYVNAVIPALETGLQLYTRWKKRNGRENHYHKQARGSQAVAASNCALSTSLRISASRIKETYDVGFVTCRGCLATQLNLIRSRIRLLQKATETSSGGSGPLDLNDIFQTSEAVRISSVRALSEQYSRLVVGRPLPREIPLPKSRSSSRQSDEPLPVTVPRYLEDDKETAIWSTASPVSRFQSEPPSPPRTPELVVEDIESTYGGAPSEVGGLTGLLRPKNSVFSIFCPEAMALQVDLTRPVPSHRKCKCGYRWKVPELLDDAKEALLLKDGFRITRRFLAKSHCDQRGGTTASSIGTAAAGGGGYGCVLCTSSGRTETYETAEQLRAHMNVAHTKWQMLHDRDMA